MAELYKHPLAGDSNLVSYWRMEGNSNDSKGSNTGSDTTISYSSANGKYGQGANFNGTSSGIAVADAVSLRLTGSFTIMAWVKPNDSTPNRTMVVFEKGDQNADANLDYGLLLINRQVYGSVDNGTSSFVKQGTTTMSDNAWHHVAMVFTATSKIEVFLDGVSDGSNTTSPVAPQSTTHACAIGKDGTASNRFFRDNIDDLAIFNRVLTSAEILSIYNQSSSGFLNLF